MNIYLEHLITLQGSKNWVFNERKEKLSMTNGEIHDIPQLEDSTHSKDQFSQSGFEGLM